MKRGLHLLLLLCLVSLSACSGQDRTVRGSTTQFAREQHTLALRKKVNGLLEKRQYRRALEAVTGRQPNQPVEGMEKEYLCAVNGLLLTAEQAMEQLDYLLAGQNFTAALTAYPDDLSLRGQLKTSERRIKVHLNTCSNRLMEQGLVEYRKGDLDKAIRTWKTIIAFNGGYAEARKAIETATVQKKSLERLGP